MWLVPGRVSPLGINIRSCLLRQCLSFSIVLLVQDYYIRYDSRSADLLLSNYLDLNSIKMWFQIPNQGRRTIAEFLSADKKSSLVGQCAVNSDKSATRSGLIGWSLTVLDLKTSCRAVSASVRWPRTICRRSRAAQPIRKCHESHVSGKGAILILNDSAPSLNMFSRDKR